MQKSQYLWLLSKIRKSGETGSVFLQKIKSRPEWYSPDLGSSISWAEGLSAGLVV